MTDTEIILAKDADEEKLAPVYEAAVKFVNERVNKEATNQIEIGNYLLKTFFEGDIEKARSQSPDKGLSLRKLSLRDDINMSFSRLSRTVNLAVQDKELESVATSQHLTDSHKVLLLSVENSTDKKNYIEMVEDKKMSVRELHRKLVDDGFINPRGLGAIEEGKKRSLARKGHLRVMRSFDYIEAALDTELFEEIDKVTAKKTLAKAESARESLGKLINKLKKRVGE